MTAMVIALSVFFSGPAFAEMSQFYNNHVGGTVYGRSPNAIQQYYDSRGNAGTVFNDPPSGISQYYFNRPSGMMQDSRTILNTPIGSAPMGNIPMGMPQTAPQIMIPSQPFGSGLTLTPFGR
jgi:hypothetical protein